MYIRFTLFLLLATTGLFAQQTDTPKVRVLKIAELEQAFRQGGDTLTVYNFWATWCRPCVAELPYFEKLNESASGRPLRVVLVSLDFRSELDKSLIPFLKKNGIKSTVWLLEGKPVEFIDRISRAWSGSIPASLFVRPSRKTYVFKEQDFTLEELNAIVNELLR